MASGQLAREQTKERETEGKQATNLDGTQGSRLEGIPRATLVVVTTLLEPVTQLGVRTTSQHQTEDSVTVAKQPSHVVS